MRSSQAKSTSQPNPFKHLRSQLEKSLLVVYDEDQLYPEYVILYMRVHASDDPQKVEMLAKLPLKVELPSSAKRQLSGLSLKRQFSDRLPGRPFRSS